MVTMYDDAMLLMQLLDMEPYPWQRQFWKEYCHAPWDTHHNQVDWERVLCDLEKMAGPGRRNGRTTALAIWLAVDSYLVEWACRPTWVNDHYPTQQAAEQLVRLAMRYRHKWSEFKWESRPFLLKKEVLLNLSEGIER